MNNLHFVLIRKVHKYGIIVRNNPTWGRGGNFEYTLVRGRRKIHDPTSFSDPRSDLHYAKTLAFDLSHPSLFCLTHKVPFRKIYHKRGFSRIIGNNVSIGYNAFHGGVWFEDGQLIQPHIKRRSRKRSTVRFSSTL